MEKLSNSNNFISNTQIENVNDQYYTLQEPQQVMHTPVQPQGGPSSVEMQQRKALHD